MKFSLYPDIYPIEIHFAYTEKEEAYKYFRKVTKTPDLGFEDVPGDATTSKYKNYLFIWIEPSAKRSKSQLVGLFAHEAVHASYLMADFMGSMFNKEAQEPQAYFVQYLMQQFTYRLWGRIRR